MVGIEDGSAEQLTCKLLFLLARPFGQEFFLATVLLLETLDGLHDEGIDNILVVVPVEALFLEHAVDVVIVHDEGLIEMTPEVAVGLVTVVLIVHVCLIDLTALDSVE